MRTPLTFALVFTLAACGGPAPSPGDAAAPDAAADALTMPPDAPAPCGGACGPGTICTAGRCVAVEVDASAPPDQVSADAPAEASADAGVDLAPPDAPRDVAAELADAGSDRADVAADVDPLAERVAALRIVVRGSGETWAEARSQSCTITGDRFSAGAEYDAPFRSSFVASGPIAGPAILGTAIESDINATVDYGAPYTLGGAQRANLRVRGMIRGMPYTLDALGCVVR